MGASGGKWLKSLLPQRKSQPSSGDQEKVVEKGKKKWRLWRSSSEGVGLMVKGLKGGHRAASELSDSSYALDDAALAAAMATLLRAPPKNFVVIKQEWAAIRIQTAFRAFLARRALRALRAVVRIQAIFRGRQVRKQAAITLRCMQALVRAQARARAQSVRTSLEGQDVQNLFGDHSDQADPSKQAEQRWCASPGTLQDVRTKLQMRQEGIIKRERAMSYSLSQQQLRSSASPNSRKYKPAESLGHNRLDKSSSGWSWLDRWMAAKPWENRLMEETHSRQSETTAFSRKSQDHHVSNHSCSSEHDLVRVRRNNMTTKVCAKPPTSGQITGSSSDPISESLYGDSTTSASTSASLTPVSKVLMVERGEETKVYKPGYMNLTESAKAKQACRYSYHDMQRQLMEELQYCNKSMALCSGDTRSISGSIQSMNFSRDLYPPIQFERQDKVSNQLH
ncbi:hypothetical protein ACJRO7_025011 [Eucalyptus globulus]|uniref:Uncharacterized protein n=1 Tax=Eucalyptus globulus TaxID=34317 RepID=A0ABD3KAN3_EUCGL